MKIKMMLTAAMLTGALLLPAEAAAVPINNQNAWALTETTIVGDGTAYVSLRTVAQLLAPDVQVSWQDGTARVEGDGLELSARPGEQWLTANDRVFYLPHGVLLEEGKTMVPVRSLAQALDGQVDWSRETGVVLTAGSGRPDCAPYSEEELYWMSRIISAESRGEPLLGKLAVGTVVMNRVASDEFPDSIYDVIFDRKYGVQFQPVANGTVYNEPTQESVLAAKMCLEGARVVGDSLYFLAPELTNNHWIMENREFVTTIGCHWFYR